MTLEELIEFIKCGQAVEHRLPGLELKSDWANEYGKKICGLGNKIEEGSKWLVVGIEDNGCICGKSESWAKQTEEQISHAVNNDIDPVQTIKKITCKEINSGWVVLVEIFQPGDVVHWRQRPYQMAGTTVDEMKPEEAMKLRLQLPGLIDYSNQTSDSEYDLELVENFVDAGNRNIGSGIDALKTLGIYEKQVSRILFGNCSFRVVKFDMFGTPVTNEEFKGLYRLLQISFIYEIQEWPKLTTGNKTDPFSSEALKEALANAVAHAAFYQSDGDIIVEIHPDRICISNLCTKEAQFFANKWFSRKHKTLNGLLMEILRYCGSVDELGLGKIKIISETIKRGQQTPEVIVEKEGRYDRWKLWVYGGEGSQPMLKILDQCKRVFVDERKALIATSLVHWRGKSLEEVQEFVEGDLAREFAEVLKKWEGPVWYSDNLKKILLSRWARTALEGHDSKALEPGEEERIKNQLPEYAKNYWGGVITPQNLKRFSDLGTSKSAASLISRLLTKWCKEGFAKRISQGKYKIVERGQKEGITVRQIEELLSSSSGIPQ